MVKIIGIYIFSFAFFCTALYYTTIQNVINGTKKERMKMHVDTRDLGRDITNILASVGIEIKCTYAGVVSNQQINFGGVGFSHRFAVTLEGSTVKPFYTYVSPGLGTVVNNIQPRPEIYDIAVGILDAVNLSTVSIGDFVEFLDLHDAYATTYEKVEEMYQDVKERGIALRRELGGSAIEKLCEILQYDFN